MAKLLKHPKVRKYGAWYLAYEAVSFLATVGFGAHATHFI
jgi:hypothetical protein